MPIHYLIGEDTYRRHRSLEALRAQHLPAGWREMLYRRLDMPKPAACLQALQEGALALVGQPFVEINGFRWLTHAPAEDDEPLAKALLEAITVASENKHVVWVADKWDKRLKFCKALAKIPGIQVQAFDVIPFWKTDEAAQVLIQEAKALGWAVERDAAHGLVDVMGTAFQPLMNELGKLATYAAGRAVTLADVQALSPYNNNVFEMMQLWLSRRQTAKRLQLAQQILTTQHPLQLLKLAQSQVIYTSRILLMSRQGLSHDAIGTALGKKPYKVKLDLEGLRGTSWDHIEHLRHACLQLERRLKQGQVEPASGFLALMAA